MALPPNRYSPGITNPQVEAPLDEGITAQAVADSYKLGVYGQLHDLTETVLTGSGRADPNFDPRQQIPEGYETYAQAFMRAERPEQIDVIKQQIDENLAIRRRRDERGAGQTIASDLFAGIVDPINLVAAPELKGAGLLAGASKGAIAIGGLGAGQELVRGSLDPTSTATETAYGIGGSILLGGALGGAVGAVGRSVTRATRFALPVDGTVTSGFGARPRPKAGASSFHQGVDIAARVGTPVQAPAAGRVEKVTTAETGGKAGISITIDHGNGTTTTYMHLSEADVHVGDEVRQGEQFAKTGATGNVTGPHLHYQMRVNGQAVDPLRHPIDGATAPPATAGGAVDAMAGHELPDTIDIDGRGVPVVVGPTETGALASFRKGKSAATMANEELAAVEDGQREVGASTTGLREMGGQMGGGAVDGLYGMLGAKLARGDLTELGAPSKFLQDAYAAGARNAEDARAFANGTFQPKAETSTLRAGIFEDIEHTSLKMRQDLAREWAGRAKTDAKFAAAVGADKPTIKGMRAAIDAEVKARVIAKLEGSPVQRGTLGEAEDALQFNRGLAAKYAEQLRARASELQEGDGHPETIAALRQHADEVADSGRVPKGFGEAVQEDMLPQQLGSPYVTRGQALDAMRGGPGFEDDLGHDLPFGMKHPGDGARMDGDHLQIDVDAILASYRDKPWTQAHIEGVTPLADDAFANEREWLNFVVAHEIEHSVNPMKDGESLADYENRINARAYEQAKADAGTYTASKSRLEALAIAPTPIGQVERLIPDGHALIRRSLQDLAGDFSLQLARNAMGGASTPGGSVFLRALRWSGEMFNLRLAIRRAYLEHIGRAPGGTRLSTELKIVKERLPLVGAVSRGLPSIHEFRADVARAVVFNGEDSSPGAIAAASAFNQIMTKVRAAAQNVGLFEATKGLNARASRLEAKAGQMERDAEQLRRNGESDHALASEQLAEKWRADAADLRAQADKPVMPSNADNYYRRVYNVQALNERKDEALQRLTEAYRRDGHPNPEAAAEGAFDTMTLDPSGDMPAPGNAATRHRSVPWTDREAFDFLVQDPELVMNQYLRRMGAQIEMTRMFGDPYGLDHLDELRLDLARRGVPRDDAEKALQIWEDMRDRISGGFHSKHPLSWDNRTARAIRNLASITTMGQTLKSQSSDIMRAITFASPGSTVRGFMAALHGDINRFSPGGLAKLAGEGMELVTARAAAHMVEADDAYLITRDTWFERQLVKAQTPFFVANGMLPLTVMLKDWLGMMVGHQIIEHARAIAAHARGEVDVKPNKAIAYLSRVGIDPVDAQIIADMPTELSPDGIHLANVMAWEGERGDRARQLMLAAVAGDIRRNIVTPGPLDKPAIFDGIFHSKDGREEALAEAHRLEQLVDEKRGMLGQLRNRDDADPDKMAAVDAVKQAVGDWNLARRNIGRHGRIDQPLASLPFQMHSFAMASGSKMLHGLLSDVDRSRTAMVLACLTGGALAFWLKSAEPENRVASTVGLARKKAGGRWDHAGWGEFAGGTMDNSGLGAWFGDLGKAADSAGNSLLDAMGYDVETPGEALGLTFKDKDGGVADQIGQVAGAGPSVVGRLIEAATNPSLPADDRVRMIRRSLPFQNLIWWKGVVDRIQDLSTGEDARGARAVSQPIAQRREDGRGAPFDFGLLPPPELRASDPGTALPGMVDPASIPGAPHKTKARRGTRPVLLPGPVKGRTRPALL